MAQQSTYTPEDGETICAGLAEGRSLLEITQAMGIPYSTARSWEDTNPEHAANSARAREIGYRALSEQCLQIADTPVIGVKKTTKPLTTRNSDGDIVPTGEFLEEVTEADMIEHRRLQIDTRLRLLGKWAPKVYGDKLAVGGDADAPPIKTESTVTLSAEESYKRLIGG